MNKKTTKCLIDDKTGKPIVLPIRPKNKQYGMTTMFGIETRDRDWGQAGREASQRIRKAFKI